MATLAYIWLAFAAIAETEQSKVTWYFTFPSCEACREAQADLMIQYARPGDDIFVSYGKGFKDEAAAWKGRLKESFPHQIKLLKAENCLYKNANGFMILDSFTSEYFGYFPTGGIFNQGRAKAILDILRETQR